MRKISISLILCCAFAGSAGAQIPERALAEASKNKGLPQNVEELEGIQYKKQNRNQITLIALGKTKEAVAHYDSYLETIPGDLEALYGLAVAYTQLGELDTAMGYAEKALAGGLPFERFLAGPRNLLAPLYAHPPFKALKEKRGIRLIHGPMVGAVTSNSANIWVRTAAQGRVEVRARSASGAAHTASAWSSADADYTAVAELRGLEPGAAYRYEVTVNGDAVTLAAPTTFRTMPATGKPAKISLGFGGGAGFTPWHEHMWTLLGKQDFDAFLLLGDNVYHDTPEVVETQRYCYYRRQSRPEYRAFTAATPIFAIWDDHDFGDNDSEGGPDREFPAWKRPVLDVFTENFANPYYGGSPGIPGVWFDTSIADIDLFFLDTRYYRSFDATKENRSMLGPVQLAWLFERLAQSTATFKIIASSVPWAENVKPGSNDTWDGFAEEREKIYSFIEDQRIDGVVLISADRHRSDAWRIPRQNGYDFYDFMSSKLTNVIKHRLMPGCLFGYNEKCSFGKLDIDTTKDDPSLTYTIVNIDGETIDSITLTRSMLEHK